MSRQYFGTDGVRGPYGGPVINESFATRLGQAAARFAKPAGGPAPRAIIGRDTRHSGLSLTRAVASGLAAEGYEVWDAGVVPTPALALAALENRCVLGVMITASHNPASDNGIKFFNTHGTKLTDAEEEKIESLLPDAPATQTAVLRFFDAADAYRLRCRKLLQNTALRGWTIAVDAANGATFSTTPAVLSELGATVDASAVTPDGANINADCGSEHPEELAKRTRALGARVGIAHDGDGDRCILCDETGQVVDGDEVLTLLAVHALKKGTLAANTLVITQQSNLGVDAALKAAGGRTLRTAVGDRYVLEGLRASGATLGGESSGHLVALDVTPTGDGLVAALLVIRVMVETGKPLSELRRALVKFPQLSRALKVREKRELATLSNVQAAILAVEQRLGAAGRTLVRYSGTEPKIRLLVEGPTESETLACMQELDTAVRRDLEVV